MKTKRISVIIAALLMILTALPMGAFAAQRDVAADSKASITVTNALENDVLAAYKIIDITYNSANNTVSCAWNSDFAEYFVGTTIEQFDALTDNSDELKDLLAGLPKYISDKGITSAKEATVAANGTATFENLAMGEYFIRPTSTTSVYQLMLQKVEPTVADNKYVIDDVTFTAKQEEVAITKTADKTSVTKKEKVTYTVTVDVPTYSANATDKSFYVSDLLPDGLTIDTNSIKAQIDGVDVDSAIYTLDTTAVADTYTFKLSVSTEQYAAGWSENGGKKLVITYTATLNDDNSTAVNTKETNTATLDYSNYPYVADSHKQKTASVDVTTFAIKIDKFVAGEEGNKLAGAKFDLYRTATQAEIDAGTAVEIPHTTIKGVKLEGDKATNDKGAATFEKYEANATNYDYYLVETQAPSGYNLLNSAIKVNFTDAEVEATAGVYTVEVPNSSGIQLPITGGMGTVIFSVLGITLMGGALLAFLIVRKRSQAKENG